MNTTTARQHIDTLAAGGNWELTYRSREDNDRIYRIGRAVVRIRFDAEGEVAFAESRPEGRGASSANGPAARKLAESALRGGA